MEYSWDGTTQTGRNNIALVSIFAYRFQIPKSGPSDARLCVAHNLKWVCSHEGGVYLLKHSGAAFEQVNNFNATPLGNMVEITIQTSTPDCCSGMYWYGYTYPQSNVWRSTCNTCQTFLSIAYQHRSKRSDRYSKVALWEPLGLEMSSSVASACPCAGHILYAFNSKWKQ